MVKSMKLSAFLRCPRVHCDARWETRARRGDGRPPSRGL